MSEIYLFRHGQASFGEDNYDKLSPIGVIQSQILGRHLAQTGKSFDAIYFGEMERQQKTAQEFIDHCSKNKLSTPQPTIFDAFNEYDSVAVWQALVPELAQEDPSIAQDAAEIIGNKKAFQRIFAKVMNRWISGSYQAAGIPYWHDFKQRVRQGLADLIARHGVRKQIAIFTSGGPISVVVQAALGLTDPKTLEVSWQLMNASITRVKYNSRGIMLAVFNDVTHLELEGDKTLLTYR
ncbi:Phosphoglycerate mutase [Olavius sp. associated proteobacterium Delta 1]|nr:Phosphoglycerate mutase [Olavius sp. associated proteobacterium Delta 1]